MIPRHSLLTPRRLRDALLLLCALGALLLLNPVRAGLDAIASIEISQAWARPTPPGAKVAAVYAELRNTSDLPLSVTEISSEASRAAELHEMFERDGVLRMRRLKDGLRLDPGASARLEPGGAHAMLFDLHRPLRPGDRVLVHFGVSDGRQIPVYAEVRDEAS